MHDHSIPGSTTLLSESPPNPHSQVLSSHGFISQDGFKQHLLPLGSSSNLSELHNIPYQLHNHNGYPHQPSSFNHLSQPPYNLHHHQLENDVHNNGMYPNWNYSNIHLLQQHHHQHHHHQQQQHQQQENHHQPQLQQHHHIQLHPHQQQQHLQQYLDNPKQTSTSHECSPHTSTSENFQGNDPTSNYQSFQTQHPTHSFPKPTSNVSPPASECGHTFANDNFEDIEEDDISDFEEEEELKRNYELCQHQLLRRDVTTRLLVFADAISSELKTFFKRSKGDEDSCDVYEDKWAATKSGRELYYADLLRIAQGDMEPASKTVQKNNVSTSSSSSASQSSSSFSISPSSQSTKPDAENTSGYQGIRNKTVGIGPLKELFERGLKTTKVNNGKCNSRVKERTEERPSKRFKYQSNSVHKDFAFPIPMHDRNLPESFWKEPTSSSVIFSSSSLTSSVVESSNVSKPDVAAPHSQGGIMASSRLPDFSDLVESWQGSLEGMQ